MRKCNAVTRTEDGRGRDGAKREGAFGEGRSGGGEACSARVCGGWCVVCGRVLVSKTRREGSVYRSVDAERSGQGERADEKEGERESRPAGQPGGGRGVASRGQKTGYRRVSGDCPQGLRFCGLAEVVLDGLVMAMDAKEKQGCCAIGPAGSRFVDFPLRFRDGGFLPDEQRHSRVWEGGPGAYHRGRQPEVFIPGHALQGAGPL